jgi:hypothetical protein
MFATLEAKVLGSIALVAILLGAYGVYTFHERAVGKAEELSTLQKSSAKLTADLQARATMAEQAYDKEHASDAAIPPVQPVRLCLNTNRSATPGAKVPGNAATSASAGPVQPVPAGNSVGPDIGPALSALAARADQVSATLREFQSR